MKNNKPTFWKTFKVHFIVALVMLVGFNAALIFTDPAVIINFGGTGNYQFFVWMMIIFGTIVPLGIFYLIYRGTRR